MGLILVVSEPANFDKASLVTNSFCQEWTEQSKTHGITNE
jgi:hypothetical protein